MTEQRKAFLNELETEIDRNFKMYRLSNSLRWCIMILVAIAGILTTAAGTAKGQAEWFAKPSALLVWGGITAVGAAINQFGNPSKSTDHYLQVKLALKGIRDAMNYQEMLLDKAVTMRIDARKNPEKVLERLVQGN